MTKVLIMTYWDKELRQMIFKFKRLNHFKQRVQSLSVLLQNQKANQNDIVNLIINKNRGINERVLRCLNSKCISIFSVQNYKKIERKCILI